MQLRHVERGIFRKRLVAQVRESGCEWRDATRDDLERVEREEAEKVRATSFGNGLFPIGSRVVVDKNAFSGRSYATVIFQEPNGGRIWVRRDGSSGATFYFGSELRFEDKTFVGPICVQHPDLTFRHCDNVMWWIVVGENKLRSYEGYEWCVGNCAGRHHIIATGDFDYPDFMMVKYAGFESKEDAEMFYMRFL